MNDDSPLDPRRIADLKALAGPDVPDLPRELTEQFLVSAAQIVEDLAAALAAGDLGTVGECAHKLKGSSGSMGAVVLHGLCLDLERAAQAGAVEPSTLADFERELARAAEALRAAFA